MDSHEHGTELCERTCPRGHTRWLGRGQLAMVAGIVAVMVATGNTVAVSHTRDSPMLSVVQTTRASSTCPASIATVPKAKVPRDVARWARGAAVVGDGALWTIRSAIDVSASRQPKGWFLKFPWYARPFGLPNITGRRLDGAGTFHASVDRADDARGAWVVSSLEFSHRGCWEVTSRYRKATIRFHLNVPANNHN